MLSKFRLRMATTERLVAVSGFGRGYPFAPARKASNA